MNELAREFLTIAKLLPLDEREIGAERAVIRSWFDEPYYATMQAYIGSPDDFLEFMVYVHVVNWLCQPNNSPEFGDFIWPYFERLCVECPQLRDEWC